MLNLDILELIFLSFATILTSGFAAVLGQGGGLILFALLALYIDLPLLIALHAVIQTCSNGSRAFLALNHINWPIIRPILVGTILGAILITPIINMTNWQWMQPLMGLYILYLTWGQGIKLPIKMPFSLFGSGILQGSLGMLLGATGPLSNALLLARGMNKHTIVASNAVIMTLSHIMKIILFTALGVSLGQSIYILLALSVAAILGSYIGNHIRGQIPETLFTILFKSILSLLALRMVLSFLSI